MKTNDKYEVVGRRLADTVKLYDNKNFTKIMKNEARNGPDEMMREIHGLCADNWNRLRPRVRVRNDEKFNYEIVCAQILAGWDKDMRFHVRNLLPL